VSVSDPSFSVRDRGLIGQRRYWRGPTWINTAWLCWLGLVRLGYERPAEQLAQRLGTVIAAAGLREYYEPHTGRGMGAPDFGWSSLIMELVEPDPSAAASHLGGRPLSS
jgi:glycogen debranching enzyme